MGQYGISIKLWGSQYQASTNEFKVENSVVYMFQDRAMEDMMYISNIVKHLVGDDSLDTIIKENIPQTQNIVKGELTAQLYLSLTVVFLRSPCTNKILSFSRRTPVT